MNKVTIYSTPSCHYCNEAKAYFAENGVKYKEVNVAANAEERAKLIKMSGQMGVPVITIGEFMVIGFNKSRLDEILNLNDEEHKA